MSLFKRGIFYAPLIAIILISGCAHSTRANDEFDPTTRKNQGPASDVQPTSYRGRLALRLDTESAPSSEGPQARFFSGGFELTGNAQQGELSLFTPLGSTAAILSWTPAMARLRTDGGVRDFESLPDLLKYATGTDIPVVGLFFWLAGDAVAVDGWRADLSQFAKGRVSATRASLAPSIELRLVLEP